LVFLEMLNNKKAREIMLHEAGTINIARIKLSVEFKYIKKNTIDAGLELLLLLLTLFLPNYKKIKVG